MKHDLDRLINSLIASVHAKRRPRVWSIIITVFGDMVVPRGGTIALSALQQIMGLMAFEENAVRTAMSRLTRDGWLARHRDGRTSFYRLAENGSSAFTEAAQRIYTDTRPDWSGHFHLVIAPDESAAEREERRALMHRRGFGVIRNGVFAKPALANAEVSDRSVDVPSDMMSFTAELQHKDASAMVEAAWDLAKINEAYAQLIKTYEPISTILSKEQPSPDQALVLRTLLIHEWRRIALRDPGLPRELMVEDWEGGRAFTVTADLYRALTGRSEEALDQLEIGAPSAQTITARFT